MSSVAPSPTTQSEVELYRVLERARLLPYYSTFIAQGGDDVSQLADASEEEFNEILTLVGMARKVLHIRRLQKVLAEWRKDRTPFRRPPSSATAAAHAVSGDPSASSSLDPSMAFPGVSGLAGVGDGSGFGALWPSTTSYQQHLKGFPSGGGQAMGAAPMQTTAAIISSMNSGNLGLAGFPDPAGSLPSKLAGDGVPVSMLPNVILSPHQLEMIATAAKDLTRVLPPYPAREVNGKKQVSRAINAILTMSADDPKREAEIRQYSPIYGRFDSPRRTGRPMTFHEVAVNEAAAQLCMLIPSLLTRRDDLFGLARQVVKMMEQNFHASTSSAMRGCEIPEGMDKTGAFDPCPDTTICSKEDIQNMQNRLQVLNATIAEVVAQQDESRRMMKASKADQTLFLELQHKIDELANRQAKITHEQAMLITQLRRNGASIPAARDSSDKDGMSVKQEAVESFGAGTDLKVFSDPSWDSSEAFSLEPTGGPLFPTGRLEISTPPGAVEEEAAAGGKKGNVY